MMSLNPILYASMLSLTLVGLWLHRRIGPNRGSALFVIGGFVLGTVVGIAISQRVEQQRRDRELDLQFDRALSEIACSSARGATMASFPSWSIDVIVMKDAAMMWNRTPLSKSVRLVDAQDKLVVELGVEGTSTSVVRDDRILQARTAVLVDGPTVHRVPLRPDARCARE
jgi:hypothetical protein